jgi:hypothetical protein
MVKDTSIACLFVHVFAKMSIHTQARVIRCMPMCPSRKYAWSLHQSIQSNP